MKKVICLILTVSMVLSLFGCKMTDYYRALKLCDNKSYAEAIVLFEQLGEYKDSQYFLLRCRNEIEPGTVLKEYLLENGEEIVYTYKGIQVNGHYYHPTHEVIGMFSVDTEMGTDDDTILLEFSPTEDFYSTLPSVTISFDDEKNSIDFCYTVFSENTSELILYIDSTIEKESIIGPELFNTSSGNQGYRSRIETLGEGSIYEIGLPREALEIFALEIINDMFLVLEDVLEESGTGLTMEDLGFVNW